MSIKLWKHLEIEPKSNNKWSTATTPIHSKHPRYPIWGEEIDNQGDLLEQIHPPTPKKITPASLAMNEQNQAFNCPLITMSAAGQANSSPEVLISLQCLWQQQTVAHSDVTVCTESLHLRGWDERMVGMSTYAKGQMITPNSWVKARKLMVIFGV